MGIWDWNFSCFKREDPETLGPSDLPEALTDAKIYSRVYYAKCSTCSFTRKHYIIRPAGTNDLALVCRLCGKSSEIGDDAVHSKKDSTGQRYYKTAAEVNAEV